MKTKIAQEANGQSIDFDVDGITTHAYQVTNTTDDNSTLRHTMKRISFNFDGMGAKRSFDSDNKKNIESAEGKPIKEILAKTFDVIIDPAGKVLMVQPEKLDTTQVDYRMKMITDMMKDLLSAVQPPKKGEPSFFQVLPATEVGVGDTWTEATDNANGKSNTTYTLSSITDSLIIVDFSGTSSTVNKAEMMGMETLTKMKSKSTGKITLNKATGIMKEKTITVESTGATEVMGNSLPLTSKTTIVVRVSEE